MKVIVNARGYVGQAGGAGGAGVFLQHLVQQLATMVEVDVLVPPDAASFPEARPEARPEERRGGRFIELPSLAPDILRQLRAGPTAVLDPFGDLPCEPFPEDMALCGVVHDLMHLERPHFFTRAEREIRSLCFRNGLSRADAVVTFSATEAAAVRRHFPGVAAPVVIPNLPYMALQPDAPAALPPDLGRFILLPAVAWPHKNHRTLIEAFGAHLRRTGSDLRLVLTGGASAEHRFGHWPRAEDIHPRVTDLGRVGDAVMRALLARAEAVAFPTLYEGFGIPALEAAFLGRMVIASRLPVLDEVLGPAGYRSVADPLCHLRWMEALAEVEDPAARARHEAATAAVRARVSPAAFLDAFLATLRGIAERYAGPARYPARGFRHGDRATTRLAAPLRFADPDGATTLERGAALPVLGPDPAPQPSLVLRAAPPPDRPARLVADYALVEERAPAAAMLSAWVRLLGDAAGLDRLEVAVGEAAPRDLLPLLREGQWQLCRLPAPPRAGRVELRLWPGDAPIPPVEIHDPVLLDATPMAPPEAGPLAPAAGLTVILAAFGEGAVPPAALVQEVAALTAALPPDAAALIQWIAVVDGLDPAALPARAVPERLRFLALPPGRTGRAAVEALLTPYQPIGRLLLLEPADLPACRAAPDALAALAAAVRPAGLPGAAPALPFPRAEGGLWRPAERGRVIEVGHRIGQPVPLLDPAVLDACIARAAPRRRPRFAVIETDRTGALSHHGTVTGLFLEGAEDAGFQPVLGLNGTARHPVTRRGDDGVERWEGFSTQVYAAGSAEAFAAELAAFVAAAQLGPDDLIFLHSLAPAILLGAARFLAGTQPGRAPRIAMRFFSTAEAMRGHGLSYVKILRSILAVRSVAARMRFLVESRNLADYYHQQMGVRLPLMLNPEHPALALARDSAWRDPALGATPLLAYFGEAREEKGFDLIPGILAELLAAEALADHGFLIQTGSNQNNRTPRMARARQALEALRAKHPGRIRCFDQVETPEQLYVLMKHARAVIAPYRPEAYGRRGTGITLEALQMGLEVFALAETDLVATFRDTGRVIAVPDDAGFARSVIGHLTGATPPPAPAEGSEVLALMRLSPRAAVERLVGLATAGEAEEAIPDAEPVLWVGNDTFGEGNSTVYAAQKRALAGLGRDCLELFVPWPHRAPPGEDPGMAADRRVYGFDTGYEAEGLAWVAVPRPSAALDAALETIVRHGPTYGRLRDLNRHMAMPESLRRAIAAHGMHRTVLNYAHLLPVVAAEMPVAGVVCETHDIMAYQHAVRRGDAVSIAEKIEEFSDLARLPRLIAISAAERREIAGACGRSDVRWRLPPFVAEPPPASPTAPAHAGRVRDLLALGEVPEEVARPTPLMLRTYLARPDLQALFPLATREGRIAFFRWWFFFGQAEVGEAGFGLSPRQLAWAVAPDGAGALPGALLLALAGREDLRRAFATPDGTIRAEALSAWARHNMEREFGFTPESLAERGERFFARAGAADLAALSPGGPAMTAALEAGPALRAMTPAAAEALATRIAAAETLDLVLVGSGHPANLRSFRWFIEDVFQPFFAPKGRSLFLVGSAGAALGEAAAQRGVVALGRCERIGPMLAAARACPIPVVTGSGSPIKTIPALALNGAVTVTEHVDRAFGLAAHGIPAFAEPRAFAEDLWALLLDEAAREDRKARAARFVAEHLSPEAYQRFWGEMLAG